MTILQSILILYFFQRTKRAMQSRFLMVFDQKKKKKIKCRTVSCILQDKTFTNLHKTFIARI